MEDGKAAVGIVMQVNSRLDELAAMPLLRKLQDTAIEADAVVVTDDAFVL